MKYAQKKDREENINRAADPPIDPDEKDAIALCQYFRDNPVNPRLRKRRPNGRGERKARKLGESGQQEAREKEHSAHQLLLTIGEPHN
jgi:hypothetical protein